MPSIILRLQTNNRFHGMMPIIRQSMIEISGERALARKKFHGVIARADGAQDKLDWRTPYVCARRDGRWKIASFVGYLPREMGR